MKTLWNHRWTWFAFFVSMAALRILTGCSNADRALWTALGSPGDIICYSGGREIYRATSTGKISTDSNGWYFRESATNKLVRVSADCVITN